MSDQRQRIISRLSRSHKLGWFPRSSNDKSRERSSTAPALVPPGRTEDAFDWAMHPTQLRRCRSHEILISYLQIKFYRNCHLTLSSILLAKVHPTLRTSRLSSYTWPICDQTSPHHAGSFTDWSTLWRICTKEIVCHDKEKSNNKQLHLSILPAKQCDRILWVITHRYNYLVMTAINEIIIVEMKITVSVRYKSQEELSLSTKIIPQPNNYHWSK